MKKFGRIDFYFLIRAFSVNIRVFRGKKTKDTKMEDTPFEQKLAAYKPRLLREIAIVRQPTAIEKMRSYFQPGASSTFQPGTSSTFQPGASSTFQPGTSPRANGLFPTVTVCVCCFLLGALTMFVVMTCCFDRVPTGSRTLVAERSPGGRPARTYPVPLRMQDLDGVQSPADFMTRIRRQPVIVVEPEPERRMLRAFPNVYFSETK